MGRQEAWLCSWNPAQAGAWDHPPSAPFQDCRVPRGFPANLTFPLPDPHFLPSAKHLPGEQFLEIALGSRGKGSASSWSWAWGRGGGSWSATLLQFSDLKESPRNSNLLTANK